MKKSNYQEPMMQIIKLECKAMLADSGGAEALRRGYGNAQEEEWGNESSVKEFKSNNLWED